MAAKASKTVKAPGHLSRRCQELWAEVTSGGRWSGPRLAILQAALEALDRADQARQQIAEQGLLVKTERSGMLRTNPLLRLEASSRAQAMAGFERLRLHYPTNGV
ncbi:MAG: P27 family phage terminase small subunit [Planctomycetaceae bacterium]|nr:P27 family phage terminase small subunit [Planctomycetaceae bacterium]